MKKEGKSVNTLEKDKKVSEEKENENKGKTFGDIIVEGRTKKGLSQEKFAERIGVSRQMVSRWELNTAMPRMLRIKKISEILEIPIENLMKSKFKTDFTDTVAKNRFNLRAIMKSIAVILIILIVLYFAYVGYKFIVLNGISSKLEQYKNLDNYYFKMESNVDGVLQKTNEIWYKNGWYKTKDTYNVNSESTSLITYLDLNNKHRYLVNEKEKTYTQLELYIDDSLENGKYMYTFFPSMVKKEATNFKELAFKFNLIYAYCKNDTILLQINKERIEFEKDTFLPINQFITMQENKNIQYNKSTFEIKLDVVKDEDITIPSIYNKLN